MIKFSIIVTVYNTEKWIRECLISIQSQTYPCYECIIVNDGSTDRTQEIVEELIKEDSRFSIITKLNEGVSTARNMGIAKANGEYIIFVDGDDLMMPDCLSYYAVMMPNYNADVYCTTCMSINASGKKIGTFKQENEKLLSSQEALVCFLKHNILSCVWSKAYSRSFIRGIWFKSNCKTAEDFIFNLNLLLERPNGKIFVDNFISMKYRILNDSSSHSKKNIQIRHQCVKVLELQKILHTYSKSINSQINDLIILEIVKSLMDVYSFQGFLKKTEPDVMNILTEYEGEIQNIKSPLMRKAKHMISLSPILSGILFTIFYFPHEIKNILRKMFRNNC